MSWRGLRPGGGCAIPHPGVIKVLTVVSAEQNHLLQRRIVGRAGSRTRRGLHRSPDPFPVCAIEGPCVIEVLRTTEAAEHDNLLADRIVDHYAGSARPRHSLRMESYPRGRRDLAECGNCGESNGCGGPNDRPQGQDKAGKISHLGSPGNSVRSVPRSSVEIPAGTTVWQGIWASRGRSGTDDLPAPAEYSVRIRSVQWLNLIPARDCAINRPKLYAAVESQVSKTARPVHR